jgi:hypothetical protein
MKPQFSPETYNDVPFAIAFVTHVGCVLGWVVFAGVSGNIGTETQAVQAKVHSFFVHGTSSVHVATAEDKAQYSMILAFSTLPVAVVFAMIWLALLQTMPDVVVKVALVTLPVMCGLYALVIFVQGNLIGSLMMFAFTGLLAFFVWRYWSRAEFTGHLFKSVSAIYAKSKGVYGAAVGVTLVQCVWMGVWLCAVIACHARGHGLVSFFALLFSFYWGSQVMSDVLYVTCGGVVARWYYNEETDVAVQRALKLACTNYFGSICFGSLVIAVIQTLRAMCEYAKESARENDNTCGVIMAQVADYILGCVESLVQVFNKFVYAFISISGMPFYQAGEKVWNMWVGSEGEALAMNSLVDLVSIFGSIAGAVFTCCAAVLTAWRMNMDHNMIVGIGVLGLLVGFAVMSVMSRLMEAGCTTLLVAYVESPEKLPSVDLSLVDVFGEQKKLANAKS